MLDFGLAIQDAGKAVVSFVKNAVAAVSDFANRAVEAVKELGKSFSFIGAAIGQVFDAIGDLFSGDFAGALRNLGAAMTTLLDPSNWAAAGDAVLSFFGFTVSTTWPDQPINCDAAGIARGKSKSSAASSSIDRDCNSADAKSASGVGCFLQYQLFQKEYKIFPFGIGPTVAKSDWMITGVLLFALAARLTLNYSDPSLIFHCTYSSTFNDL